METTKEKFDSLTPAQIAEQDTHFLDYVNFDASNVVSKRQGKEFVVGLTYVPTKRYDKLVHLYDGEASDTDTFERKKSEATYAVLELDGLMQQGKVSGPFYNLAIDYHIAQLRKMYMVEAAKHMTEAASSSEHEIAQNEFVRYNRELFGEVDKADFNSIMRTEQLRVQNFIPASKEADAVKEYLDDYFSKQQFDKASPEQEFMSPAELRELAIATRAKLGDILAVVPDDEESVAYKADEIKDMFNRALEISGLAKKGWKCELSESKTIVSTETPKKIIYLPETMPARDAAAIKRLVAHEVGIHALRGSNGEDSGVKPLETGTGNYADVEEGAGVLLECALAGNFNNPSFDRARDRYIVAGLALGTDGGPARDSRQSFELTWRLLAIRKANVGVIDRKIIDQAKAEAMTHIDNAYRATDYACPGIIYRKLKVYYEGMKKNAEYFKRHSGNMGQAFNTMLIGKYDHTDESKDGEAAMVHNLVAA